MTHSLHILVLVVVTMVSSFAGAESLHMRRVKSSIAHLQPRLPEQKVSEYARYIIDASRKYDIDPSVLVAIAQQESSFRDNLPEGKAGEIGICQIRKLWLTNAKFQDEFGAVTLRDLRKPARNFMFAAWILDGLKKTVALGTLPYWSYYNAVRFENRFKYFLHVNRKLVKLRRMGYSKPEFVAQAKPAQPQNVKSLASRTVATSDMAAYKAPSTMNAGLGVDPSVLRLINKAVD